MMTECEVEKEADEIYNEMMAKTKESLFFVFGWAILSLIALITAVWLIL